MYWWLSICFVVSFFSALWLIPSWIKKAEERNLSGKDMHKSSGKQVAEAGGICVIFGFLMGLLTYIAFETFYFKVQRISLLVMGVLLTVFIITIIGLIDDILGWKRGLKQWQKPLLTLLATLPMIVLNVGVHIITIPFFGAVNLGLVYTLIFIPLAIVGTSNGFNLLAGYNGLEAGLGGIILAFLGFFAWKNNLSWVTVIAYCMVFALLAFYLFNKYPAKIFPGDTMTYTVGALIACVAILGNIEKAALIMFIPFFLEFILKARGKFKKESFAKLNEDGSLSMPYEKIYGLEHFAIKFLSKIKKKVYEKDVVWFLFFIEFALGIIALLTILK